jgi:acyl-[acyl-carrier-protein]-UDP-N-acetylglucosamine O-acyltransferase
MAQMYSVHPDARIGNNVHIGDFTTIYEDVEIGDNCTIYGNVTIFPGARIGSGVKIFPGAVVSAIPQDLKFRGEETTVEIGDNNMIRECVTIHRGTASKGKTVIGNNCLIMAYAHIAHDCVLGSNIILANAVQLAGEVEVDDFAIIGGGTLVHQFSRIGGHVMIQGGSHINKDIPPYVRAARMPISYTGINTVGLRRRNFSNETIALIQDVYRSLFASGMNTTEALAYIESEIPASKERDEIVAFVRASSRGIIKGLTGGASVVND